MRSRVLTFAVVIACVVMAGSVFAQQKAASDPLTGTWTGDWGPSAADRNTVSVDLKWDGKAVTGSVTSERAQPISIEKGTFDAKTGAVHLEADFKRGAQTVHYVIDGKIDAKTMSGSWNHDNRKGDFKITKK